MASPDASDAQINAAICAVEGERVGEGEIGRIQRIKSSIDAAASPFDVHRI